MSIFRHHQVVFACIVLIALVVVTLSAGPSTSRSELVSELKAKSATQGLAMVAIWNRDIDIIPFGRRWFSKRLFGSSLVLARMSADGTGILGYTGDRESKQGLPPNQIGLMDTRGQVQSVLRHDLFNVVEMALSPDRKLVAFFAQDRTTRKVGLFYGDLGSDSVALIEPTNSHDGVPEWSSIGWAADGQRIVFSKSQQVWIYDLRSTRLDPIAAGLNPSWSPNGKWISFQSLDGFSRLLSSDLQTIGEVGRGRRILSSLHWSPDSEYAFVMEDWGTIARNPVCYNNTRLVVYRLRDNAYAEVYDPCGKKDSFYGWIVDSQLVNRHVPRAHEFPKARLPDAFTVK